MPVHCQNKLCELWGLFRNYPWPAQGQIPGVLPNRHPHGESTRLMWCFSWCHSPKQAVPTNSQLLPVTVVLQGEVKESLWASHVISAKDGMSFWRTQSAAKLLTYLPVRGGCIFRKGSSLLGLKGYQSFFKLWNCGGTHWEKRQGQLASEILKF